MRDYTLSHVCDDVLLRQLAALVAQERITTASMLAHIAEVDARRLYAPAGYPSMHAYCVEELRLSEDAASKRIQAARAARRFPALFPALAEGRLHLTALNLLAPHLTDANALELIEMASYRRKCEIEEYLARRFGPGELTTASLRPMSVPEWHVQHALAHVECHTLPEFAGDSAAPDDGTILAGDARTLAATEPLYLLQVRLSKSTREKLRHAQALLSHAVPNGDIGEVLDRALDRLIVELEKRKVGVGNSPARKRAASARKRYIPAEVRRAVWERDGRQCTFVSDKGVRCGARTFLEFDHVDPVARGGEATVTGIRLRCRAHNQYEAERIFGAAFMERKLSEARLAAAGRGVARQAAESQAGGVEPQPHAKHHEQMLDLLAALRTLGLKRDEAIRAAEATGSIPDSTLEDRMRAALEFLGTRSAQRRRATVIRPAMST